MLILFTLIIKVSGNLRAKIYLLDNFQEQIPRPPRSTRKIIKITSEIANCYRYDTSDYRLSRPIPSIESTHDFAPLFLHQFILLPDHIVLSIS